MKLVILTSRRRGNASRCLPVLCSHPNLQVVKVILAHGLPSSRKRLMKRKLQKTLRIGLLGALNGIRLRDWYKDKNAEDIYAVCNSLNIQIAETESINCDTTRRLFKECDADFGLSLGNGYISKSVFSIPKYGMINAHAEILPQFRCAASVIWPIYEGMQETGFAIHQIDTHFDTGDILSQRKHPIVFYPTLRETVEQNLETTKRQIPEELLYVCENYEHLKSKAVKQGSGKIYITPTFWQFLRMVKNNRKMYRESLARRRT